MTPRDLLDEFEDDAADGATLTRGQRRRATKAQQKAETQTRRAEKKREYHRRVAERRSAPVRGWALAVFGILFFGGLWVIGTVSSNNNADERRDPIPMLSYAPPTTDETSPGEEADDLNNSPERVSENALRNLFLNSTAWPNYFDPIAVDQADDVRLSVLAIAKANTLTIREVEWIDAKPAGHTWTGTARVQFTEATVTIDLNVTLDFVDDQSRVVQLVQVEPSE